MKYTLIFILWPFFLLGQNGPIDFEPNGQGSNWTWTVFDNGSNPQVEVVPNYDILGDLNISANYLRMRMLSDGTPFAGIKSAHGADIGLFELDSSNAFIRLMIHKPIISEVGIRLISASDEVVAEVKVTNKSINMWENLIFDFSAFIGKDLADEIDQIVILPDIQNRSTDYNLFIDDIMFTDSSILNKVDVVFIVNYQGELSIMGSWNNWSDFPGTKMDSVYTNLYEFHAVRLQVPANQNIEFKFLAFEGFDYVFEALNYSEPCTNRNSQNTNRFLQIEDQSLRYCRWFGSCDDCFVNIDEKEVENQKINLMYREDGLIIVSNNADPIDRIALYDMQGKLLQSHYNVEIDQHLPVHTLTNGVYMYYMSKRGRLHAGKIYVP